MKKCFPTLILTILVFFCYGSNSSQAQTTTIKNLPPGHSVRVTTGSVEIKGWERELVKHSPNLARWHWDALYANTQGYIGGGKPANGNAGSHYVKPIHAPTPIVQQNHYIKPTHIPFNVPNRPSEVVERRPAKHESPTASRETSIKLKTPSVNVDKIAIGKLRASSPEHIATYEQTYSKDASVVDRQSTAQVYGQLKQAKAKKGQAR